MVYIKKVVVRNFKSFGGMVKLNFQKGFNVITGPNGSGKSNIIDAVQFVLGELGSKRMRVPDLSGLIYDGGGEDESRNPQVSQVTLYFDNSDRGLAVDRETISVGRKIDRQGKSNYYLNGKRTSRKSVVDLLEMAGITPGGYNIVLQGMATRLSDLTPSERMTSLEGLIGITEYDEKKAEAKVRLNEAERKIEIASARIDEVRKRVNDLERQRNDALRHELLTKEERRLNAYKLSLQINQLESRLDDLRRRMKEHEAEVAKLDEERAKLIVERDAARTRLEEFNMEAAERGNTRLPLLKSDLVGKKTLKESMESRIREIENRKEHLLRAIESKEEEIERSRNEIVERKRRLEEFTLREEELKAEIEPKVSQLREIDENLQEIRATADENQRRIEGLTEMLVPMQESMSGLDIEINRHIASTGTHREKIAELERKKGEWAEAIGSLREKLVKFDELKEGEANKLGDMLLAMEEQVNRQKQIRSTINNASELAKQAETTITELTAKRDLWKHIVTEEKARDRIREMGEAGAIRGYHGPLRILMKVDLPYQRAVRISSDGWIQAIVVNDVGTALECIERLKKTKLGMTRFIPLDGLREAGFLPDLDDEGVIGLIPKIVRYDERYAPVVNLVWGDTYLVKNKAAAQRVVSKGFRAVTKAGEVFELAGGIIGGYYRRPPDFSKLIPSEESVKVLSTTIKTLRERLRKRMGELRLSGDSLRRFNSVLDQSKESTRRIDEQIEDTNLNIERLERNISAVKVSIGKVGEELSKEETLITTLRERRARTLEEIERTKAEIAELKGLKPSDVTGLEVERNGLGGEVADLKDQLNKLQSDTQVQRSFVERILSFKAEEAEGQKRRWWEEIQALEAEHAETKGQVDEISTDIGGLEKVLEDVTSDVESTTRVVREHQKTLRGLEDQIDRLERRRSAADARIRDLSLEAERLKLQGEQRMEELARLGFEDQIVLENTDLELAERLLQLIRSEKASLGAINQLAVDQYAEFMGNYKQLSIRINELEEEKASILRFIEEVEQEKQEHFMSAFNQICENFSNIFAKLTGGGDGRLELQKPEDPFSGGVDLYVQFPGKPMRLASGASGGERSVAAIAYLLAIQRFIKSPFYLFDEIDAHLDDINTSRLAEVLKEHAEEAQFLMVSLKDVMVHTADRIYGVFSQGGRSRVLALPIKLEVPA